MNLIVTGAAGRHEALSALTAPRMETAARVWGADFRAATLQPGDRPASWGKLPLLRECLSAHERVLWLDADVVLHDVRRNLFDELNPAAWQAMAVHAVPGETVPNCGVWALGPAMLPYLDQAWEQADLVHHAWWEQAAMLRLMGYETHRPPGDQPGTTVLWEHTQILDPRWNIRSDQLPAAEIWACHWSDPTFERRLRSIATDCGSPLLGG